MLLRFMLKCRLPFIIVYTLLKIILPFGCVILVTTPIELHNNNNNNRMKMLNRVNMEISGAYMEIFILSHYHCDLLELQLDAVNNMHISHSHHLITSFFMFFSILWEHFYLRDG